MKGPISYMAKNHVASNMLMIILLVGGIVIGRSFKQEVFPEYELDMISCSVAYPGAAPEEIEDAIVKPIELAVSGVENIKHIRSSAVENFGVVNIEVIDGADVDLVLQDVKSEVDRIITFPKEAEKPVITKLYRKQEVITLMIYGGVGEHTLVEIAERVKDDLLGNPNITQIEMGGNRPYEISIEVPEENLRKYNLKLEDVARAVRQSSLELAGGTIRAESGDIMIRTSEKRYIGSEFDSVAVLTLPSGQQVLLSDIAQVRDEFAENEQEALFDGKPAVMLKVFRVGEQTPKGVSAAVRDYVELQKDRLPDSVQMALYNDFSIILQQRLSLLAKNGLLGLVLVLLTLSFFLEMRLAMMVALGIAVSFSGSLLLARYFDVTINMISLFAFLIIIGLVVDDAIVVGENIFVHHQKGKSLIRAAIDGTMEVGTAVIFSALTTVAAFGPLLFVGGFVGKFLGVIPIIIISVLVISLVEALFILPSHLSSKTIMGETRFWSKIEKKRAKFDVFINWLIEKSYRDSLKWALKNRLTTMAIAVSILLISVGLITSGLVKFIMMPDVDADWVTANLVMAPGTPYNVTKKWTEMIEEKANEVVAEYDAQRTDGLSNCLHTYALLGQQVYFGGAHMNMSSTGSNLSQVQILLQDPDTRNFLTGEFAAKWRKKVGEIPGAEKLNFESQMVVSGADVEIQLSHSNENELLAAIERFKEALGAYSGVSEVEDSYVLGKKEMQLTLRPDAATMGITEYDLASQVRFAFFGAEALRIQRGQNEVKVMVRYPEKDRQNLNILQKMRIRTPQGKMIPFNQAAYIEEGRGFSEINRTDRRRIVNVSAKVDNETANSTEIIDDLKNGILKQLEAEYPGLGYDLEGQSRDMRESAQSLIQAFMFGLILIYGLLAIPFRSFFQPLIVMSAIPFGLVGAIIGHLLLGMNMSMISMFGIVALSGVVVNSSLVLIDFINKTRTTEKMSSEAVIEAGVRRFRPIIMTALTTFFGLTPMILATEIQAKFLVPMAVSLGFGVLFSTAITLIVVPTMYMILEDIKKYSAVRNGGVNPAPELAEEAGV